MLACQQQQMLYIVNARDDVVSQYIALRHNDKVNTPGSQRSVADALRLVCQPAQYRRQYLAQVVLYPTQISCQ